MAGTVGRGAAGAGFGRRGRSRTESVAGPAMVEQPRFARMRKQGFLRLNCRLGDGRQAFRRCFWTICSPGWQRENRRRFRCGRRFWRRFSWFCGFLFQPDDFRFQFTEAKGKFLDASPGLHGAHNQPDGQSNGNTENHQDDDTVSLSIKFPFCRRNDLDERSLRFGARTWQAGMARLRGPRQNRWHQADSDLFSHANHSRPGARKLIDKKCSCFSKINAAKSAGKGCFRRIKGASAHFPRSKRAFRSEFRVYAAKGGECPEPPEGGTPNGGNARMRPRINQAEMSC